MFVDIEWFLLYLLVADVLSEDTILKWYKTAHNPKGKSVFLEQIKKFVDWLENAEEGNNFFDILFILVKICSFQLPIIQSSQDGILLIQ